MMTISEKVLTKVAQLRNLHTVRKSVRVRTEGLKCRPQIRNTVPFERNTSSSQKMDPLRRTVSPLQSMREFFMHPLTWDRNNGYLNILLGLAIFGFCFFNSCTPCEPKSSMDGAPPPVPRSERKK